MSEQDQLADAEVRLERLARLRAKAFAIGDTERQRSLTLAVIYLRKIEDREKNDLLTPARATRLRTLWLVGRLAEYRLDGPAIPEWIEQQRQAVIDGAHFWRMAQMHQARASRLVPRRALQDAGRSAQRPREHAPRSRRTRTASRASRDGPDEPEPPLGRRNPDGLDDRSAIARDCGFTHISDLLAAELDRLREAAA